MLRRIPLKTRRRATGPNGATRAWVIVRDEGCCIRCGADLVEAGQRWEIQHRLPRGMGGTSNPATNRLANLILLGGPTACDCHAWVESRRREAYAAGWLVRRWRDPLDVPVLCARRGLILLDHNGEWKAAE